MVAPSRERGSKLTRARELAPELVVAPSRERGSKRPVSAMFGGWRRVAPSRERGSKPPRSRTARGPAAVAPSRERGSKPRRTGRGMPRGLVAPSRERGSKHARQQRDHGVHESLPHGSVDRNATSCCSGCSRPSRSLTGAWIETRPWRAALASRIVAPSRERGSKQGSWRPDFRDEAVAPSRERGSKPVQAVVIIVVIQSLPHGSVDRNPRIRK